MNSLLHETTVWTINLFTFRTTCKGTKGVGVVAGSIALITRISEGGRAGGAGRSFPRNKKRSNACTFSITRVKGSTKQNIFGFQTLDVGSGNFVREGSDSSHDHKRQATNLIYTH